MRARVLRDYICKVTGRYRTYDDVITVTKKRYEELKGIYLQEVTPTTKLKSKRNGKIK